MFFDKEVEFVGKHATYCRFLKEELGVFKTFKDIYATSAIVGFINGRKADKDNVKIKGQTVQPASIMASEVQSIRSRLTYIYRIIMLLEPIKNGEIKDYQDRTFKDDANAERNPERLRENLEVFNAYARGGLEFLYDKFKDCKSKKEAVNVLNDYLIEFYEDTNLVQELA